MKLRYLNPLYWLALVLYIIANATEGTFDAALKRADEICPPKHKTLW